MFVLNLNIITNEEKQAIHCRTLYEAQLFYDAVKSQRPDIRLRGWDRRPNSERDADKAYMLSYLGCKSLKYGDVEYLRSEGIEIITFDRLSSFELPEVEANQTGILSLLGL